MISWTIDIATNCELIDLVSTDDNEIADIALSYGNSIRPRELATDKSPVIDTVIHYLKNNIEVLR